MNAEIIAAGSELLTPSRIDTNSLWLTARLNELGIEVTAKLIVGDDRDRLASMVRDALGRSDLVLLSGGLGPTEDDVTRDAVAQALGRPLEFRQELFDVIAGRFRRGNRTMASNNRRQAWLIAGFEALPNPNGSAPGQWALLENGKAIALLPGPPVELKAMYTACCEPRLKQIAPPLAIATLELHVAGMTESELDERIAPVYGAYTNPVTTVLAAPGDIQVHLRARCATAEEANRLVAEVGARIEALLGDRIYSRNGDPLEAAVGALLKQKGATLSVAESCTGGMLAQRITSVAGSSAYFVGGFLVYTNRMKTELLGVDPALIDAHTAVSDPVVRAMASGARERTGSSHALAVTGYAGPDGGTPENPVGTVWLALAAPSGVDALRLRWVGTRERVRVLATTTALDWLRRSL